MDNASHTSSHRDLHPSHAWFRPEVFSLPSYVPGKPAALGTIKLASNEVPFPTLSPVQAAVAGALGKLARYPDMAAHELTSALASSFGWPDDGVVLGNGSTALIEKILHATLLPGSEAILAWRSFEAYPIAIQAAGGVAVKVPLLRDGSHDLRAMAKAVTPHTRAILLCSPNNPTGVAFTHEALAAFLAQIPASIPVVLDEAYIHFVRMDDPVRSLELLTLHENLIVLRTFSKAYGLAGLRCGFALCSPTMAQGLRAIATPFGVNSLAQVAAVAALRAQDAVKEQVEIVIAERERLTSALAAQDWHLPASNANFLWFELGKLSRRMEELCRDEGVIVRRFADEGVRVTVAEPEGSLRLLRALARLRAERQG